jgi:hypothetical protein
MRGRIRRRFARSHDWLVVARVAREPFAEPVKEICGEPRRTVALVPHFALP